MLTTLSFQRRQILQISLLASFFLLIISFAASSHLIILLNTSEAPQEIQANPQLQNLKQAVDIINEQTL
jgi:hypothetical protein